MVNYRNPGPRQLRTVTEPLVAEPPQPLEDSALGQEELFDRLARTLIKGNVLKNSLHAFHVSTAIPVKPPLIRAAVSRFHAPPGRWISYQIFTDAVDYLTVENRRRSKIYWDALLNEDLSDEEIIQRFSKTATKNNLIQLILDGAGIATLFLLAKMTNLLNLPNTNTLTLEEVTKASFLIDSAIGIALYLALTGEIDDINRLGDLIYDEQVKVEINKIKELPYDELIQKAGLDPEEVKAITRYEDAKKLINYSLDYIASHDEGSLDYDHWTAYAAVVVQQERLSAALEVSPRYQAYAGGARLAPVEESRRYEPGFIGPFTQEYLQKLDSESSGFYDSVYSAFKADLQSLGEVAGIGFDVCCILAFLDYKDAPLDKVSEGLRNLASYAKMAAVDPRNLLNAACKDLAYKLSNLLTFPLTKLFDYLERKLKELSSQVNQFAGSKLGRLLDACLGLQVLNLSIEAMIDWIKSLMAKIKAYLYGSMPLDERHLEIAAHKRLLLELASSLEYVADNLTNPALCKTLELNTWRDQISDFTNSIPNPLPKLEFPEEGMFARVNVLNQLMDASK